MSKFQLASRVVRQATKDREIGLGKSTGVTGWLKPIVKFIGSLINIALKFLQISIVTIFQWIYQATIAILNFDWNMSDEQISQAIEANNLAAWATFGSAVGGATAWLACIGVAYVAEQKIPVLRGKLVVELAKEAGEEAYSLLYMLLTSLGRTVAVNALLSMYRDVRRWLMSDHPAAQAIAKFLFGNNYEYMRKNWGKNGERWSIFGWIEDQVEKIPDAGLRTFTENLLDEFGDELTECLFQAAYIIQQTYDDQLAVQDYAYGHDLKAPELIVDIAPNKSAIVPGKPNNEIIRVTAPNQLELKNRIQDVLTTAELIGNRDIGIVFGEPAEDRLSSQPFRRQLVFTFRGGSPKPPFKYPNGKVARTVTVTIPHPKVGLTWTELKLAAKPFIWGRFRAIAQLSEGRKAMVHGASPNEAENTLRRLLKLSQLEILTLSITEEKYKKNQGLYKDPETVYPQYATLTVRRDNMGEGRNFTTGERLAQEVIQVILWTDREPLNSPQLL